MNYKKGLISFCETGEYSLYTDYFLNKQIERIKEIEEVAAINKVNIIFVKRTMEVQISITTTNNEVVEVEVVI